MDGSAELARHEGGGPAGFDDDALAFRIAAVMCAIVSAAGTAVAATRWTLKRDAAHCLRRLMQRSTALRRR